MTVRSPGSASVPAEPDLAAAVRPRPRAPLPGLWWLVVAGLAGSLAAITRLSALDLVNFSRDDSWLLIAADAWLAGGSPPLVGIGASLGVQNGAATVYLAALPLALGFGAPGAFGLVALLHSLAAGGLTVSVGRVFGWWTGLAAGVLFALQPWAIVYGRGLALAGFLPPFIVGYGIALWLFAVAGRRRVLPVAALLAGLLPQVHLGGFWLWPLLPFAVALRPRALTGRTAAWALILWIVPCLPWVAWNAAHEWIDLGHLRAYAATPARVSAEAWRLLWDMAGTDGYGGTLGAAFERFVARGGQAPGAIDAGLHLALAVGVAVCLAGLIRPAAWSSVLPRDPGRRGYALLLAWFAVIPLALTRTAQDIYPHYVFLSFPALQTIQAIGIGVPFAWLAARRRGFRRWAAPAATVACLCLFGVFALRAWNAFLTTYAEGGTRGGFGPPLGEQIAALDRLFAEAGSGPAFLVAAGDRPGLDGEATNWEFLRRRRPAKTIAGDSYWVYPDGAPGTYLVAPDLPAIDPAWKLAGPPLAEFKRPADAHGYRVRRGPAAADLVAGLRFDAGHYEATAGPIHLIGQVSATPWRPGTSQRLRVVWRPIAAQARPHDLQLSVQLLDSTGRRVAQVDRLGYPATNWTPGEVVVNVFDLPLPADLPPGPYTLETSLYRATDLTRLDWRDPAGQNAGNALRTTVHVDH